MRALVCIALVVAALTAGTADASVPGAASTTALLRGIPQQERWLGQPKAPIVVVEYVDFQCPYCAEFSRRTLPDLIRRYVRTGRVRILFNGMAFLGPESGTALRWAYAAGRQHRLWNVAELLFANQGAENRGWVTRRLLTSVARSVPGLDLARVQRDVPRVTPEIAAVERAAKAAKVPGTPYLEAGRSLLTLQPLRLRSFDIADLARQLDGL